MNTEREVIAKLKSILNEIGVVYTISCYLEVEGGRILKDEQTFENEKNVANTSSNEAYLEGIKV